MLDYFSLLFVFFATVIWYSRNSMNFWAKRRIAHEKPKFFWGNMKEVGKTKHFVDVITHLYTKFKRLGPFCGLYYYMKPVVVIVDPVLARRILAKECYNFEDRGLYYSPRSDPLTHNLFRVDARNWLILRQKMYYTINLDRMTFVFPSICKVGVELAKVCNELAENSAGRIIEVNDLIERYTSDVIGKCVFGVDVNALHDPQDEFLLMGKRALSERRHNIVLDFFIERYPNLARKLRFSVIPSDISSFYTNLVRETIEDRERSRLQYRDFMNVFIEMKRRQELNIKEITGQAYFFFMGGFHTLSSTLSFTLYEIAKQPAIQERMREELEEAIQMEGGEFTPRAVMNLHYTELVLAETLRKYPTQPVVTRAARHMFMPTTDPYFFIQPGQTVLVPVYAIHHDPEYFPQPDRFVPERFLGHNILNRPAGVWLPFGDGPRNCLGLKFAKIHMCIALANLLRHFRFSVCRKTERNIEFAKGSYFLVPKNGIHLRVDRLRYAPSARLS